MLETLKLRQMLDAIDGLLASRPIREPHQWRKSPYGRRVRITYRRTEHDPPLGAVGDVLTEAEHGITRGNGFILMTPNYPGVRGHHFRVRLVGENTPRMLSRDMFKPA